MTRYQLTYANGMFEQGYEFSWCDNDVMCFSRDHIKSGMKEYVYVIETVCSICNEPYVKRRNNDSKSHSKCKMKYKRVIDA